MVVAQMTVTVSVQLAVGGTGHAASTNQPVPVENELLITGLTAADEVTAPPPLSGRPPPHGNVMLKDCTDGPRTIDVWDARE